MNARKTPYLRTAGALLLLLVFFLAQGARVLHRHERGKAVTLTSAGAMQLAAAEPHCPLCDHLGGAEPAVLPPASAIVLPESPRPSFIAAPPIRLHSSIGPVASDRGPPALC